MSEHREYLLPDTEDISCRGAAIVGRRGDMRQRIYRGWRGYCLGPRRNVHLARRCGRVGLGTPSARAACEPCPGGASVGEEARLWARGYRMELFSGSGAWCCPKSGAMPGVRLRRAEAARRCRERFLAHV
jgi:hypothetical protein